ncbi:MAG TPA: UDP-N-acetylmuramoyl-L-alanine--D-glutamate ligase, partial [Candidatus Paceibacterota bacterium]|nr:UDP-N-acetylmuramoyl-L-alanine--D-glutamate ligase [Candidatus Paceibacterota bacterium]
EDFRHADLILKAAGVPQNSPYVAEAQKHGIPVRMSADLFAELSELPLIGITGTRGKSTTTHLIAHILEAAGYKTFMGGNIRGVSTLSHLASVTQDTVAVLELDSWQLQGFGEARISPHIAVFTTFMPDHMNYYHNSMEEYFADKANIFINQKPDDTLILGEQMAHFVDDYGYKAKIAAHTIIAKPIPKSWPMLIPGEHNQMDAGIALAATEAFGVDKQVAKEAIATFAGVPGRLELAREVRGIKIYNDTTATVPDATLAALHAVGDKKKKNILLIMGGADKMLDMSALVAEIPDYAKGVFLLTGTGTQRILPGLPNAHVYVSLREAVEAAMAQASEGDIVLMSPAFASFGMFKNEYDRGDQFMELISHLN